MPFFSHTTAQETRTHRYYYAIEGQGPLLIMLHNGFYSQASFDPVVALLQAHFTCVRWDRWGYGQTGRPGQIRSSLEDGAVELDSLLLELQNQGLDTNRFDLWGHCMGGAVAATWAHCHPGRTRSLVLEATGFWYTEEVIRRSDMIFSSWDRLPTSLKRVLKTMHGVNDAWAVWENIVKHTDSYVMSPLYDLRPTLRDLSCPVLVANGDHDVYFSPGHAVEAVKVLSKGTLWLPANCGHDIHREQPAAITEQFLLLAKNTTI